MAAASSEVVITWLDKLGKTCKTIFYFAASISGPTNTAIVALIALVKALTQCTPIQIAVSGKEVLTATLGSGPYSSEDKAVMTILDSNNKSHNFGIPMPKSSILLANKETVDLTNTDVIAFFDAMNINATGEGGATLETLEKGTRRMKKPLKK